MSVFFFSFCISVLSAAVFSQYLYILSSANQLRRGEAENVCCREKETPAVLLEGQRVPRAAGEIKHFLDLGLCDPGSEFPVLLLVKQL